MSLHVGDTIHGFANGYFGRDSYQCRVVEAEGSDWLVTRNAHGQSEFIHREDAVNIDPENINRSGCGLGCKEDW